jgi:glycosyltransferase involved in cell wall biosynthesis
MRIAYLISVDPAEQGIGRKAREQISAWKAQGHEVTVFTARQPVGISSFAGCTISSYGRARQRLLRPGRLAKCVERVSPDIVYLRLCMAEPGYSKLFQRFPAVAEVNTHDLHEYKLTHSRVRYWYHVLTRRRTWSRVAGFIFVTSELADSLPRYGIPHTVIPNGIDLSAYSLLPPASGLRPALLFVGTPGFAWHGVQDIIDLARRTPEWDYHVIGYSSFDGTPENVHCHGRLEKTDYLSIARQCDIGLGTFALHLKKMQEACALKVREYLAWGLPVILGHRDADFPSGAEFLLSVPNRRNGLVDSIEAVRAFIRQWKGIRVPRRLIGHIDAKIKETVRIDFFHSCARSR